MHLFYSTVLHTYLFTSDRNLVWETSRCCLKHKPLLFLWGSAREKPRWSKTDLVGPFLGEAPLGSSYQQHKQTGEECAPACYHLLSVSSVFTWQFWWSVQVQELRSLQNMVCFKIGQTKPGNCDIIGKGCLFFCLQNVKELSHLHGNVAQHGSLCKGTIRMNLEIRNSLLFYVSDDTSVLGHKGKAGQTDRLSGCRTGIKSSSLRFCAWLSVNSIWYMQIVWIKNIP